MASLTTSASNHFSGTNGFLEFEKPLLRIHDDIEQLEHEQRKSGRDLNTEIRLQQTRLRTRTKRLYSNLTAWETVLVARHPKRPLVPDYLNLIVDDFCELHGDRAYGDDLAMVTGFGRIAGHKVMVIGHNKGKDTKERIACNFGCAHPEGYRKALLKMKLAEKYGLPIVCLIDTQGAYPGIGSEERGISQAIAVNLMEMSRLKTRIVCAVIGEGGSGGALGIAVGDRVAMFEHSFYSVISPEGCAAILFKTGEQRQRAAESLKLTAKELKKLGVIDEILPEPLGGAHRNPEEAAQSLERYLGDTLRELKRFKTETVLKRRYERLRNIGGYFESISARKKPKPRRSTGDGRDIQSAIPSRRLSPVKPNPSTPQA
ncbi:MAG: acetyl-CoA carboxylase carboxyltransferase subunit alpha [Phycisphaerae bacterium]